MTDRLLRTLRPLVGAAPLIGPVAEAIGARIHRHRQRRYIKEMLARARLRETDNDRAEGL
nr:hypothetical protein OG296_43705 [Streptomyces sp. NBC_01001]